LLQGEWYLQPVLSSDTAAGKVPILKFETDTKKFTGNTGCNAIRGTFEYTRSKLVFGKQIVSTKMACQGYNEEIFIENLLKTNNYKIENGVLMLMQDETILSRWKREMPQMNPQKA